MTYQALGGQTKASANTSSASTMYFTAMTMLAKRTAPDHKLSFSLLLWVRLTKTLRRRSAGVRESGAYLLGIRREESRRIIGFVPYDDLDPACLNRGYIKLSGRSLAKLWAICEERRLEVLADVHVHPGDATQSSVDRANPMISIPGHVALILPRYAIGRIRRSEIGMYVYLGAKRWDAVPYLSRKAFLHIGF